MLLICVFSKVWKINRKHKKTKTELLTPEEQNEISDDVIDSDVLSLHRITRIKKSPSDEEHLYKDLSNENYERDNLGYSYEYLPLE